MLTCSCCGTMIEDSPEQNTDFGKQPNPHDTGFGMCPDCGGDKNAADVKKKLGWAACSFYEARFPILRKALTKPELIEKWEKSSYLQKCNWIGKMIEKGLMI